jgi:hypothetical protein
MSKLLPIVNIGTKSGSFKYILAQLGQKYLIRGDPAVDHHGNTRINFKKSLILSIIP